LAKLGRRLIDPPPNTYTDEDPFWDQSQTTYGRWHLNRAGIVEARRRWHEDWQRRWAPRRTSIEMGATLGAVDLAWQFVAFVWK